MIYIIYILLESREFLPSRTRTLVPRRTLLRWAPPYFRSSVGPSVTA